MDMSEQTLYIGHTTIRHIRRVGVPWRLARTNKKTNLERRINLTETLVLVWYLSLFRLVSSDSAVQWTGPLPTRAAQGNAGECSSSRRSGLELSELYPAATVNQLAGICMGHRGWVHTHQVLDRSCR